MFSSYPLATSKLENTFHVYVYSMHISMLGTLTIFIWIKNNFLWVLMPDYNYKNDHTEYVGLIKWNGQYCLDTLLFYRTGASYFRWAKVGTVGKYNTWLWILSENHHGRLMWWVIVQWGIMVFPINWETDYLFKLTSFKNHTWKTKHDIRHKATKCWTQTHNLTNIFSLTPNIFTTKQISD